MIGVGISLSEVAMRRRASGGSGGGGGSDLFSILDGIGHSANLLTCLDAGALASYGGSGQTWADLSPNNGDFYLGTDGDVNAEDPTFSGVAGALAESVYFSGEGTRFTQVADFGAQNFHKAGAAFTIAAVIYHPDGETSDTTLLYTGEAAGTFFGLGAAGPGFTINESGPSTALTTPTGANWHFVAVSFDRAGGATGIKFVLNEDAGTHDVSTVGAESGDDAETATLICSANTGAVRSGAFMTWSVAKSAAQLETIRAALKAQRWTSLYEAP